MLRVAIVDDHHLFRKSLCLLIKTFKNIEVVIEAENGKDFFDKLKNTPIDIVCMDIQMPEMNGFETCKKLHKDFPKIKIMIVSQMTTNESIHRTIELGAHGFFSKKANPDELENAIKSLAEKGYYFGMELDIVLREALMAEKHKNKEKAPIVHFTAQELTVIKLAMLELSSGEIAEKLFINVRTVDTHRKKIMEKTGSKNFTGAIIFALRHYHISLDH